MSLPNYSGVIDPPEKKLNAVICIYQKPGWGNKSPVNLILEKLQAELKNELNNGTYESIRLAFVYELPKTLGVRRFEKFDADTPTLFKEYYEKTDHSLSRVIFMGLALLERERSTEDEPTENRLYLVTDDKFKAWDMKRLVYTSKENFNADENTMINARFALACDTAYLYKTSNAGGGEFEKKFKNIRVFETKQDNTVIS